jgi:hypothetical protein
MARGFRIISTFGDQLLGRVAMGAIRFGCETRDQLILASEGDHKGFLIQNLHLLDPNHAPVLIPGMHLMDGIAHGLWSLALHNLIFVGAIFVVALARTATGSADEILSMCFTICLEHSD